MRFVRARLTHLPIIQKLAQQIWTIAYKEILSEAQIEYMLNKFYSIESLEYQYKNKHLFCLVEFENRLVGFASYELNFENSNKSKLHKIYVLTDLHGKGIGNFLLEKIEKQVIKSNNKFLLLNVNRFNKAQDFYKSKGFEIIETIDIEIGNGYLMEDFVMQKQLVN